jgi:GntP family gluconate:H+ symporter
LENYNPLIPLAIGVVTVIGMIMVLRINAFIALITAAIVVSLMAPGEASLKISRVAEGFGTAAGNIGIVIGLAAVIGECMMVSGAADRIVLFFLRLLGKERAPWALLISGYILAVPVFFDTVFYLLVPLARSLYKKTGKNYLLSILCIAAGGAVTHTLVPPTPGPLLMANNLGIDLGAMIVGGASVALPAAIAGLLLAQVMDARMQIPFREVQSHDQVEPLSDERLPPFGLSILPVVLPVVLISCFTIVKTLSTLPEDLAAGAAPSVWDRLLPIASIIGNSNLAMLLATAVSLSLVWYSRQMSLTQIEGLVERSLMSGGVIILITAGGGAFGEMLKAAQIGPAIQELFASESGSVSGMMFLVMGYAIAALLKVAQGSSTVAMITASGMLAATVGDGSGLGYHPVYLATAIGAGSLLGSWMNDSGFWIFAKMGGLNEREALKTWTILLAVLSVVSFAVSVALAILVPLAGT